MSKLEGLLVVPPPSRQEIREAVRSPAWQRFRRGLKGESTEEKLRQLRVYANKHTSRTARVRVHNYVNALKRGGLLR